MDSYILRIYRKVHEDSHLMVGTLETPDGKARYVFRTIEELWRILAMETAATNRETDIRGEDE